MIVVVFEVTMRAGKEQAYFDLAEALRAELERIDGFISVERFASLSAANKFVSISTWRDDAAVIAWKEQAEHRATQAKGKADIFAAYRIRVAEVMRDYTG